MTLYDWIIWANIALTVVAPPAVLWGVACCVSRDRPPYWRAVLNPMRWLDPDDTFARDRT